MVVEIGLVHPPVGMNVYIINRLAKDVPLTETFKGVVPFLLSDFVRILLLVFFPVISLFSSIRSNSKEGHPPCISPSR